MPAEFEGDECYPAGDMPPARFGAAGFVPTSASFPTEAEDGANTNAAQGNLLYVFFFHSHAPRILLRSDVGIFPGTGSTVPTLSDRMSVPFSRKTPVSLLRLRISMRALSVS